jgi:hypothetical protein
LPRRMVFSPRFPDKYRAIGRALVDSYHRVLTRPYFASGTDPAFFLAQTLLSPAHKTPYEGPEARECGPRVSLRCGRGF